MELISTLLSNPLYILLFGSGGVLVIALTIIAIVFTRRKRQSTNVPQMQKGIVVDKSKKINITENQTPVNIMNSEEIKIHRNKS